MAPKYIIGIQNSTLDFNSTIEIQRATNSQYANRIIHNFDYRLNTVGNVSADLREFEAAFEQDNSVTAGDYLSGEYANVNASGFGLDMGATLEMDISGVPIIDGFFGSKKTGSVNIGIFPT